MLYQFARIENIRVNCSDVEAGNTGLNLFLCRVFYFFGEILIIDLKILTYDIDVFVGVSRLDSLDGKQVSGLNWINLCFSRPERDESPICC